MKYSIVFILIFMLFSCAKPKVRKPIIHKTSISRIQESIALNQAILQYEAKIFKEIVANDTLNTYHASPYGFWYYYNKKNKKRATKVKSGSELVINYQISDVANRVILSEKELGTKNQANKEDRLLKIDGEDFLLGLHEGIQLMEEGEVMTFLLPSNKAFGVTGLQGKIGANQPLIIKVKVKRILNK